MAILNLKGEDYDEAEKHLDQALRIQSKRCDVPSPDHADLHNLALILSNQGNVKRVIGNFSQASKSLEQAIKLYRQILPSDRDGTYRDRLADTLYLASDLAGEMGNDAFQIDYLREAADLQDTEIRAKVLLELAVLRSAYHLPSAITDIHLAADLIPSSDSMIDANILVWATRFHGQRVAQLRADNPTSTEDLAAEEQQAIDFLQKTVAIDFFNPLAFGIMLSTRDDFRPLDHLYGFWKIVYTQMQVGISNDLEEANKPESAAYYFAARAAIAMAVRSKPETDPQFPNSQLLREQAHRWLTLKLERLRNGIAEKAVPAQFVEQALGLWLSDEGWASVRDDEQLDALEATVAESWREFWSDVSEMRNELQASKQ